MSFDHTHPDPNCILVDDKRGGMLVHDGGEYAETTRCILLGIDHLTQGEDKSQEGELHKVVVQQLLRQHEDPVQSTIGHDLTRYCGRLVSPAQLGRFRTSSYTFCLGQGRFNAVRRASTGLPTPPSETSSLMVSSPMKQLTHRQPSSVAPSLL